MSTYSEVCQIYTVTLSTSITPVSQFARYRAFKMYLKPVIENVWSCAWRLRSIELRDALGGRD
jgi:hypothetical protein